SLTSLAKNNLYKVISCGRGSINDMTLDAYMLNDSIILGGGHIKPMSVKYINMTQRRGHILDRKHI
ncbi:MAG: hypothetical protein LBD76_05390, partial [Prevotellaceae bacterium]|nr:hypothetical protein [Prevotellaceae bacterium]